MKSLDQLLHQAVVLRRMLRADAGVVSVVVEGAGAEDEKEEACWAGTGVREEMSVGEGRSWSIDEGQATEGKLLLEARARYIRAAIFLSFAKGLLFNLSLEALSPFVCLQDPGYGTPLCGSGNVCLANRVKLWPLQWFRWVFRWDTIHWIRK